jgi:hypothetical protein
MEQIGDVFQDRQSEITTLNEGVFGYEFIHPQWNVPFCQGWPQFET